LESTTLERWLFFYFHLPEKEPISSTDKPVEKNEDDHMDFPIPRCLAVEEIPDVINHFRVAARNAMDAGKLIIDKREIMQIIIKEDELLLSSVVHDTFMAKNITGFCRK